jgi:Beta-lactamase
VLFASLASEAGAERIESIPTAGGAAPWGGRARRICRSSTSLARSGRTGPAPRSLGDVVETLSGQRIDASLESRIFRPLGMHDTAYTVPQDKHARVVTLHQRPAGRLTETPNPATR